MGLSDPHLVAIFGWDERGTFWNSLKQFGPLCRAALQLTSVGGLPIHLALAARER